jgi:ABC-type branched-subunit amino acid transport system substrate-binding protein
VTSSLRSLSDRPKAASRLLVAASLSLVAFLLASCGGTVPARPPGGQVVAPPPQEVAPPPPPEVTPPALPAGKVPLAPGEKAMVGLLLPLSGPNASLGQGMLDAAQVALFDIQGNRIALLPRDTHGTADGAAAAAQDALDQGARLLIGPLTAPEVQAVKPVAAARGVAVLGFSTEVTVAGDGAYVMGLLPSEEVRRVVSFAHQKGAQRFAVLAPGSPYGQLVVDALKTVAQTEQVSVVDPVFFDPSAVDLAPSIRQLAHYDNRRAAIDQQKKQLANARDPASQEALRRLNEGLAQTDLGFDALLLPEGGQQFKLLGPLLPQYGIDPNKVHLLGTGLWDDPALATEPQLEGAWYAAPDPNGRADFEKRFATLYGHPPPRLATLAYDATALAAALSRNPEGADFSADALTNANGFVGLDGIFRFRADGRVERGLAVIEIHRAGSTTVSPEPQSFTGF